MTPATAPSSPGTTRFTLDGSPGLESRLADLCEQVRSGVARIIPDRQRVGLLLGGGYGRGEGGVLREPGRSSELPYNDLEFYAFVRGPALIAERAFAPALHALGEQLAPGAGIDIEFKVITPAKLRRSRPSMFLHDLVAGHRLIEGDPRMLDGCDHHRDPTAIPLHEATRLLLNRASGLLFAADLLRRPTMTPGDADFVGRNLAKARLALGDVVLTAFGRYHDRCAERHRRMAEPLPADADADAGEDALPMAAIREHHAAGVRFKFHPSRSTASAPELTTAHRELVELTRTVWLWLERRRLDIPFDSPEAYSRTPHPLCPETPPLRNRLVNARAFGPRFALLHRDAGRHPRERLLRSLPLLLFDRTATLAPDLQPLLAHWLASDVQDPPGLVAAYRSLWNRFS